MRLTLTFDRELARWSNEFGALAERAPVVLARALNHEGAKAKTAVVRALAGQTGLKVSVIRRAVREGRAAQGDPARGYQGSSLTYTLTSRGGDVRLKFFSGRETRAGVTAAPWGSRRLYPGTFMKGGRFPGRVPLGFGGHAMRRTSGTRLPIGYAKSGLYIPDSMVEGASLAAFEHAFGNSLADRISHELFRALR